MAGRRTDRVNQTNGNQIPQRVEDAARTMMNNASSGPRRGYIPNTAGRQQIPQQQWQQVPPGYYNNAQNQQPPYGGYYAPQQPQQAYYQPQQPANGAQRGYTPAYGTAGGKQKTKKKGHKVLTVLACLVLIAALGTGGYFAITNHIRTQTINDKVTSYDGLFCPGVYVDGIHLGGMTPEQAENSVISQIRQQHDNWKVQLTYNGEVLSEINADMLGFSVDTATVLTNAWAQGHTGTAEQRYDAMLRLEQENYSVNTIRPEGNTSQIDQLLTQLKAVADKPAEDAKLVAFHWERIEDPFEISDEVWGQSLDIEPLKDQLYQMAATMQSGTVEIELQQLEPSVKKADILKDYTIRSDVTTEIDRHSEDNRNSNIRHAFEFINGYRLDPGKTFSFNGAVGERTIARGFLEAEEYVYGEHQRGIGGGVCQAATTVYQAAVKAGLKIVKRQRHSDSVSYADYGMDATVYWSEFRGGKKIDMTFINNTEKPIYIVSFV